ncbi:MAG: site-2 protease family protein [Acidimicrobiales bacterium]
MSLRIGRFGGIPITVQPSVIVVTTIAAVALYLRLPSLEPRITTTGRLVVAGFTCLAFVASILLHEVGHALVARRHRVGVAEISLWLFGGVAKLTSQAPTPRAEFQIAIAGPATNLVLGAGFGLAGVAATAIDAAGSRLTASTMLSLCLVNIALGLTNLVPAAPLDGGRVLTAVLWRRLGQPEPARLFSARIGLVVGIVGTAVAAALLVRSGLSTWLLATLATTAVVAWAARSEIAGATVRHRLSTTTTEALMVRRPASVSAAWSVEELLRWAGDEQLHVACPVTRWNNQPVGIIVPAAGLDVDVPARSWTKVADLMVPNERIVRAWSNEPVERVLDRVEDQRVAAVVVHDPADGRWVGTLTDAQTTPLFQPSGIWGSLGAAHYARR